VETERLHYLGLLCGRSRYACSKGDRPMSFGTGRYSLAYNGVVHCVSARCKFTDKTRLRLWSITLLSKLIVNSYTVQDRDIVITGSDMWLIE